MTGFTTSFHSCYGTVNIVIVHLLLIDFVSLTVSKKNHVQHTYVNSQSHRRSGQKYFDLSTVKYLRVNWIDLKPYVHVDSP